jgi:hypothetical protein
MWSDLDQLGGGVIDREQPERSWNEFVLRWQQVVSSNPLS